MLEPEELKRRLDAARTLRGLKQSDLAEKVSADGLGKHDVGRLERGAIPLTRALRDALCRHLRVPEAWFTEPDVDRLVGYDSGELPRDELAEALREQRKSLDLVLVVVNAIIGSRRDAVDEDQEDGGLGIAAALAGLPEAIRERLAPPAETREERDHPEAA